MIVLPVAVPLLLLLLAGLLVVFVVLVELRVLAYAYQKIGIRPRYVFTVMLLTLLGSHVNIPVYETPVIAGTGRTVIAVNVGGALIPTLLSLYLFFRTRMYGRMLVATAVVAIVVNRLAQVVPGVGIAVPMLVPPLVAAAVALVLAFRRAPPLAYVSGTMGALIGADILNLARVGTMGAPIISIGGAGTFDGVFLTGIIAGLLA